MSSINFVNAYWLLLAIPLVALFAVPFFLAVRKDNVNWHNVTSGVLHVVMAVLIAFAAAGTNVVTTVTETDVYVLADVSYSANRNLDLVDDYIDKLSRSLPNNSKLGVVCFAKDQKLLSHLSNPRSSHGRVADALNEQQSVGKPIDDSQTDIVAALEYTGSLFREGVIKRIVIITDGAQTYAGDSNALKRAVDKLALEKIKVDAIFLDNNITPSVKEVQISDVQLSGTVIKNRAQTASVIIQSSYQTSVNVILKKDDAVFARRSVDLSMGSNSVAMTLDTAAVGSYEYEVTLEPPDTVDGWDANPHNNRKTFSQTVSNDLKVLLVSGNMDDYFTVADLFEGAEIDYYGATDTVPITVEALCLYDEIILANLDVRQIPNCEMFTQSLNTVVSMFGKSLLTIGDIGMQLDVDGRCASLKNMLPVRFGDSDDLPKLYTIVIDTSSSMGQAGRMNIAKSAAKHLVDSLAEEDEVAIVWFNGNSGFLQSHTRVGDAAKRAEIKSRIDGEWVQHGTEIKLGFREVKELIGLEFSQKQVMLISDGRDLNINSSDYESPIALVDELRANGIFTSVIDVGRGGDAGGDASQALSLLKNIASEAHGGGSYHFADSEEELEDVVFSEIDNDMNETIVNQYSFLEVRRSRDDVLDGIEFQTAGSAARDYVGGFVNNRAIPLATTVLTADYEKAGGNVSVPIYAYRALGNGRVASFTSNLSSWIRAWDSDLREGFIKNMLETNIPAEKNDYPFTARVFEENGSVTLEVIPAMVRVDAQVHVTVTLPDGQTLSSDLALASTLYSYTFAMPQLGKYDIAVQYSAAGQEYEVHCNAHHSYLAEYNSFTVFDAGVLSRMVGTGGKVSEDGNLVIENDKSEVGTYTLSLVAPLLISSVVLFAIDIVIRKLKWEDIVSLFRKVKK